MPTKLYLGVHFTVEEMEAPGRAGGSWVAGRARAPGQARWLQACFLAHQPGDLGQATCVCASLLTTVVS